MIAAIACCPCTALLVPDLATGTAADTASLRIACDRAVAIVLDAGVDHVIVAGPSILSQPLRNFAPGVELPSFAELPLPQAIGWFLLDRAERPSSRRYTSIGPAGDAAEGLDDPVRRVGLLVMGDGSARRGEKAPGYLDPRAEPFDDAVGAALGKADIGALADLDEQLAADLLVSGVGPWKALAAAASPQPWKAELLYADAPFGVAYFVASWLPAGPA